MDGEDNKKGCQNADLVVAGPDLGGGVHLCLRHRPDHSHEIGVAAPLKDGQPIAQGAMILKHREANVFDVEPVPSTTTSGPARVTSNNYRAGWDNIFGKQTVGEA